MTEKKVVKKKPAKKKPAKKKPAKKKVVRESVVGEASVVAEKVGLAPTLDELQEKLYDIEALGLLCHGTTSKFAGKIGDKGIVPRDVSGTKSVWDIPKHPKTFISRPGRVYLAPDNSRLYVFGNLVSACEWAASEAANTFGGRRGVFDVDLDSSYVPKLRTDDDVASGRNLPGEYSDTVDPDIVEWMCTIPLQNFRDHLEQLKEEGEGEWWRWMRLASMSTSLSDEAFAELVEWMKTSPSDEAIEELCTEGPEWWKSAVVGRALAYEGEIPPDRVRQIPMTKKELRRVRYMEID